MDVAATPADALILLDRGAHYCLTVLGRSHRLANRVRAHPLVDEHSVIEIEGVGADAESTAQAITLAERQAELLAPVILEHLEPGSETSVVH